MSHDIDQLRDALRRFAAERDWGQFHSPKNLAISLSIEAGEVLEHFQWLTEDESHNLDDASRQAVALELADVLLYLLQLSDKLGIDMLRAAREKIELNARRYPADKAKGTSTKYTEL